jgi:hypothetical protein
MKGGQMEKKKVVTRLRVVAIKPNDMKFTSYRIEMKLAEPRVAPAPYVHRAKR